MITKDTENFKATDLSLKDKLIGMLILVAFIIATIVVVMQEIL